MLPVTSHTIKVLFCCPSCSVSSLKSIAVLWIEVVVSVQQKIAGWRPYRFSSVRLISAFQMAVRYYVLDSYTFCSLLDERSAMPTANVPLVAPSSQQFELFVASMFLISLSVAHVLFPNSVNWRPHPKLYKFSYKYFVLGLGLLGGLSQLWIDQS